MVDLRLVGAFHALPLAAVSRTLTPIADILMLAASGTVLFAADATALIRSPHFLTKLLLIAVALAFRIWWRGEEMVPWALRMLAGLSILLWLAVAALGRLIAYA